MGVAYLFNALSLSPLMGVRELRHSSGSPRERSQDLVSAALYKSLITKALGYFIVSNS